VSERFKTDFGDENRGGRWRPLSPRPWKTVSSRIATCRAAGFRSDVLERQRQFDRRLCGGGSSARVQASTRASSGLSPYRP